MPKRYDESLNVYDAARQRIAIAFRDFENVLVAFSAGKDSGVMLNLAYEYAREKRLLHKLSFYYEDYEAGYRFTHEYAERTFRGMEGVARKFWLCLPISAACAVSMHQTRWIPWDADAKDIWVRPMPELPCVVNQDNCPFEFVKGTKGFDTRVMFAQWFATTYGKTAVLIGIRADESLTRLAIFTAKARRFMHKGLKYSVVGSFENCHPYAKQESYACLSALAFGTIVEWPLNCRSLL